MKVLQIFVLIFGLVIFVDAQKSILTGSVTDKFGAVIPDAKILVINDKGEKFETISNDEGIYVLNLFFNSDDTKTSIDSQIAKYEITVDLKNRGFEKFVLKNFNFAPTAKTNIDIVLTALNPEFCGYSGADCPRVLECFGGEPEILQTTENALSDKILTRPLEKLPKAQNKRKNKNNKQ